MTYDYDLLVIGAGSGGLASSKRAASYGAKVGIIERDLVGGTCVIRGCIPKKLMVYAAKFAHLYQDAKGYGWGEVQPSFDWSKLVEVVDKEVRRLSQRHIEFLQKAGVELIEGDGTFVDPHTLDVNGQKLTAEKILIAVGGEPVKPHIPGIEFAITSREMFLLPQQPQRLAIIGGGYIGVEFACIMNNLGTKVSHTIRRDRILSGFDSDIRSGIQDSMIQHGIEMFTETLIDKIEVVPEGLQITLSGKNQHSFTVDTILCATGRKPILSKLGLENAGVEVVNRAIAVKPDSCTSQPNIYAVGDCTDRINLTPVAIAEGRAFADTVFGHQPRSISHQNVASAIFSDPEAASVGMSEAQACKKLGTNNVVTYRARFRPLFHSLTGVDEKVMVKLVVDKHTDVVLGAHMVGENAAEIIQGIAIAVNMRATKKDLDATIGIHPSSAEEFVTLR